jgi:hypothetical protein
VSAHRSALVAALAPVGKGELAAGGVEAVSGILAWVSVSGIFDGTRRRKSSGEWFLYDVHIRCYHISIQMSIDCLPIDYSNEGGGDLFE